MRAQLSLLHCWPESVLGSLSEKSRKLEAYSAILMLNKAAVQEGMF